MTPMFAHLTSRSRVALSLASLALALPAWATPLTYEDAQRMAMETNPTVQSAERSFEQAGHEVFRASGSFDPELSANGGWNERSSVRFTEFSSALILARTEQWNAGLNLSATSPTGTSATLSGNLFGTDQSFDFGDIIVPGGALPNLDQQSMGHSFGLNLSQNLLRGIRYATNMQSIRNAKESRSLAELRLDKIRQQALKDVADAYWTWVYQVRLVTISDAAVDIANEDLRIGTARVEAGQAAPVERTRLMAASVRAQSAAIDAANGARQAADTLLLLLGHDPGADIEPGSDPGTAPTLELSVQQVVDVALAESLDLQIARMQVETSQLNLADARHNALPTLSASLDAGLSGASDTLSNAFELNDTMFPNIGVSGNFSMPLGNRVAIGRSRVAAGDLVEQRAALHDLERQIRAQVEQQVRLLGSAKQKVDLADANMLLATETLAAEEALYAAGRSLLKDVLESRNEVDRAQAETAKARTDFRVAEAELARLQGRLVLDP